MRSGQISRSEYLTALDARGDACAGLRVFAYRVPAEVLQATAADGAYGGGPLAGIPLAVKDNIDTVDAPTTAGTEALSGRSPRTDAAAVRRIRAASGLVAGKNVMHELALGVTSNNPLTGAAGNPHDPALIPGGSSGGTAAAVAAGIVPGGLGTDTGGSARQPASLCGIVGFRPSLGRYPGDGVVPLSRTRDTIGPMARSVDDVVLLDAILSGAPAAVTASALPGIRIGVPHNPFYRDLDPEVDAVVRRALDLLADAGAQLVPVDLSEVVAQTEETGIDTVLYELRRDLPTYLVEHGYDLTYEDVCRGVRSPDVRELVGDGTDDPVDLQSYQSSMQQREWALQMYRTLLRRHAVGALVQPTCPLPARPIGRETDTTVELNGRRVPTFPTYIRHTNVAGALGLPAISLPAGHTSTGLPVGIELNAAPGDDTIVLGLAREAERVLHS